MTRGKVVLCRELADALSGAAIPCRQSKLGPRATEASDPGKKWPCHVPFPFDDLGSRKARPAVCITEPLGPHRHVVLAFVTSREPEDLLPSDIVLDPQDPDFKQTGLQVRSTVRTHRLLTVASQVIRRELGRLSPRLQARVTDAMRQMFGL